MTKLTLYQTHVKGGHFLSQDILDFDNSFFRLNAEVAAVRALSRLYKHD